MAVDRWIVLFTVAGAVARVVAAYRLPWIAFDTIGYIAQAEALAAGRCDNFFPNGFPALLAVMSAVTPDGWQPEAFIGVNVAASTLAVPLAGALARALGGAPFSQRAAAAAVAVWPTQVNAAGYVLTEAPSTCLLLAATLAMARGRWIGAALLLGAVSVIRTSVVPAAIALVLVAWLMRAIRPSRVLPVFATMLLPALALGAVCVPRSGTLGLGSNFSYNISLSHIRTVESEPEGPDEPLANTWNYLALFWEHPRRMMEQRGLELLELWGPGTPLDPARPVINQALIGLRFPLILMALWMTIRRRVPARSWLLWTPIAAVTLVHVATLGHARFSVPLEPLAIVLVATACWTCAAVARRTRATRASERSMGA